MTYQLILNKVGSICIIFLLILCAYIASLLSSQNELFYILLLYCVLFLGYGHFIIGGYYQLQKPLAQKNKAYIRYFACITVLTGATSLMLIQTGYGPLFAIAAIIFFIFHGTLNEDLHFKRLSSFTIPPYHWFSLGFLVCTYMLFSLAHPSFFFTPHMEYISLSQSEAWALLHTLVPPFALPLLAVSFVCAISTLSLSPLLLQKKWNMLVIISLFVLVSLFLVGTFAPLDYTLMFFALLSYHFISWAIFGYQNLRAQGGAALCKYLLINLFVYGLLGLMILAGLFFHETLQTLLSLIFNFNTFIVFTYIHISTSLLNEPWLQKILHI